MTPLPPSFRCSSGEDHVPYTLVCDNRKDCLDNSDEDFCVFPGKKCTGGYTVCGHTLNSRGFESLFYIERIQSMPNVLRMNRYGYLHLSRLSRNKCPATHFKCLSIAFCLPVYVRCNNVNDCPEKEDEKGCDHIRNSGYYRCRGFRNTLLHPAHLCDHRHQCPQQDDEAFCQIPCPAQCSCLGHSWFCRQIIQASMYPQIRFLDAENSGMKPSNLTSNTLLIHLSLSNCGVVSFKHFSLPNLRSLDLEGNRIRVVKEGSLKGLLNLNTLFLTGNPLTSVFSVRTSVTPSFPRLTRLDLSGVKIASFSSSLLDFFPNLQTLNLSGCGIESIPRVSFQSVPQLHVLDISGCPLVFFPIGMLKRLSRLRTVRADDFKVCCPVNLPDNFDSSQCTSPDDKISSCYDLFKSNFHRVSWNIATSLALVFNVLIFSKRLKGISKPHRKSAVDVFITGLFMCGCIHGVYMLIISLADASYRGNFIPQDAVWKHGPLCITAGFLWILSIEISLFLVSLITIDRFLMSWWSRTPWWFSRKSAVIAICVVTAGGVLIALVPSLSRWKLLQRTALCSPLLNSIQSLPGEHYTFGVFSVFNVIVSTLAGLGQLSVYIFLHGKRFAFIQSPNETKELSISRRVMAVVLCNVVYCLVIGQSTHVLTSGLKVPDTAVLVHVVVMPFVWTLKPVLHVAATLLEHRRRDREERMLKIVIAKRHN